MIRYYSKRGAQYGDVYSLGTISKNVDDLLLISVNYDAIFANGDYISSIVVSAFKQADRSTDATTAMIDAETVVEGTATGGSTTTLVQASNLSLLGLKSGDQLINTTKGFVTPIKSFSTTSVINDTAVFDTQTASASSDAFQTNVLTFKLQAGDADTKYIVEMKVTSNGGFVVYDRLLVNVRKDNVI